MRLERLMGMLGLAMRAGRVIIGLDEIAKAAQKGKIKLIVHSVGASDGTKKKIRTKCDFYAIPNIEIDVTPEELGKRLGKRQGAVVVGISDDGFAKTLLDINLKEE